ncbi:hypothetical protein LXA43DRAFT_981300 [Ganoderma leucocontextum]|nr:hypothetical protein LXA43DRAFT_981300 [Ganoderma leucocontextum]
MIAHPAMLIAFFTCLSFRRAVVDVHSFSGVGCEYKSIGFLRDDCGAIINVRRSAASSYVSLVIVRHQPVCCREYVGSEF